MFTTNDWTEEGLWQSLKSVSTTPFVYSRENWMRWKKQLLSEARGINTWLYHQGIVSHPCEMGQSEIVHFLISNGFDVFNKYGQLDLSSDHLKLVLYTSNKGTNPKSKKVLKTLREIIRALELYDRLKNIDRFHDTYPTINKTTRSVKVNINMVVSNGLLMPAGNIQFMPDFAYSEKGIDPEETVFSLKSMNSVYRKVVLRIAGVDESRLGDGGFFVEGLNVSQEVELIHLLMSGKINLTGELKSNLEVQKIMGCDRLDRELQLHHTSLLLQETRKFLVRHLVGTEGEKMLCPEGILVKRKRSRMKVTFPLYSVLITGTHDDLHLVETELLEPRGNGVTGEFIPSSRYNSELKSLEFSKKSGNPELRMFNFLDNQVIEKPLPIIVHWTPGRGNPKPVEVHDIYQTNVQMGFDLYLGEEIQVELGDEIYPQEETWGTDALSQLKLARNKSETGGVGSSTFRRTVLGGLTGLKENIECLQKQS